MGAIAGRQIASFQELLTGCPGKDHLATHADNLHEIIVSLKDSLDLFREDYCEHKAVKDAWTDLENGAPGICAYKEKIETLVEKAFGPRFKDMILDHLCPLIEYINQYLRSHDSVAKRGFWASKIADVRRQFRSYDVIDQDEIDKAINMVWAIGLQSAKSNSFVESVNSVIRGYLNTYQSVPSWFCSLFTFFRNHHVFSRGKRAKKSPLAEPLVDLLPILSALPDPVELKDSVV